MPETDRVRNLNRPSLPKDDRYLAMLVVDHAVIVIERYWRYPSRVKTDFDVLPSTSERAAGPSR